MCGHLILKLAMSLNVKSIRRVSQSVFFPSVYLCDCKKKKKKHPKKTQNKIKQKNRPLFSVSLFGFLFYLCCLL